MSKDEKKFEPLADDTPGESSATDSTIPPEIAAELDEEEKEFRALRRDLPGVKGSSAAGIVTLSVGKAPAKNEFFRTHPDFRPVVPLVNIEVGMEKQYFAVTSDMIEPLKQIGITVSDHTLYLTVTSRGAAAHRAGADRRRRRQPERIRPHQGDRPDPGHAGMGEAVHRP